MRRTARILSAASMMLCLCLPVSAKQDNTLEADLSRLDKALDTAEEYVRIKELRINTIENMLSSRGTTPLQQYNIYGELYEEYSSFQFDKAVEMLAQQERLARQLRSPRLLTDMLLEKAMLHLLSGLHLESDRILSCIDTTTFTPEQQLKWYDVQLKFQIDYAEYLGLPSEARTNTGKVKWYSERLEAAMPKESAEYRISIISKLAREGRNEEALAENAKLLKTLPHDAHEYAIASYWQGAIYENLGDIPTAIHWWTESAICDIRTATKDNASLYCIAMKLSDYGEIDRAFRYTQISLDDAIFFNSMLRRVQIASTLPWIEKAYSDSRTEQESRMQGFIIMLIVAIAVMAAATALAIYLFLKMRRSSQVIEQKNSQLESYSRSLEAIENDLKETNRRLREANSAKEEYLGLFLSQSSTYLDKLRKLISREQYEAELKNFYKNFDTSFLELYPTFVEEFNSLLCEDARIRPKESDRLTIELRIFALIKLGITQSSHIASLLRYSVNTIYNYRAQIKNSALKGKQDFEEEVKKIGQKSTFPATGR